MKITFADSAKADIVAFIVNEDGGLPEAATALDKETDGLLSEALSGGRFTGKKDQQALVVLPKGADFRRAVLIGGGKPKKRDARVLEGLGANLVKSNAASGFKTLAIHGGSLRLYVEKHERPSPVILEMLSEERALGLDRYEYFKNFSERVLDIRSEMQTLLNDLREQGKTIAGYGAAAKGAIMLNFIGAGTDVIDYVVDRNVHKQGLHMPGTHQPIPDPARILQEMPDYVVILPWNFKDEIMSQQQEYRDKGGQFIIPIPKPHVV